MILKQFYKLFYGKGALVKAVERGNPHLIDQLLTKNNVNVEYNGNTALHQAIKNNDCSTAKTLLEWGAKPNIANNYGMTPLNISSLNSYSGCMKLLLNNNAKITKPDLWYAREDMQSLYTLLANKQVHLSPEISINLKELSNNITSLSKAINYHFCNNISNHLYDNGPNNDIILSGDGMTTEGSDIF
ncbi:MAG: ankyrin repeat domain-containing protein [Rickettsia endosymbiont of Pseudomimeciton antennatum]|nr:ankyrin repeat domain-containing protein [Rickettsia endosymbiont of Pseudomimeciton antennatum]MCC8398544.1 ankyrin repeat domain-containing protein [Rickettsia endosymbiont of Labidopullus appendiculatus]